MNKLPKLISLFSGCGGSALGFKEAGCKVVFMNDLDKDACKTLEANFDIQPQQGDIKEGLENVPSADIVEGGFPCQGFSVAGPRKQTKNKNSKINDEDVLNFQI